MVDVFFSWDELPVGENFADFYKEWRGRSRTARVSVSTRIFLAGEMMMRICFRLLPSSLPDRGRKGKGK